MAACNGAEEPGKCNGCPHSAGIAPSHCNQLLRPRCSLIPASLREVIACKSQVPAICNIKQSMQDPRTALKRRPVKLPAPGVVHVSFFACFTLRSTGESRGAWHIALPNQQGTYLHTHVQSPSQKLHIYPRQTHLPCSSGTSQPQASVILQGTRSFASQASKWLNREQSCQTGFSQRLIPCDGRPSICRLAAPHPSGRSHPQ